MNQPQLTGRATDVLAKGVFGQAERQRKTAKQLVPEGEHRLVVGEYVFFETGHVRPLVGAQHRAAMCRLEHIVANVVGFFFVDALGAVKAFLPFRDVAAVIDGVANVLTHFFGVGQGEVCFGPGDQSLGVVGGDTVADHIQKAGIAGRLTQLLGGGLALARVARPQARHIDHRQRLEGGVWIV